MDESLFIFGLIFSFICLLGIIYCFLSTCLGMQIRRSDLWEALTLSSTSNVRERERHRQAGLAGDYELDSMSDYRGSGMGYDRMGMGMGSSEEFEVMRRTGPRGFL